ncbi:hypothetical protein [Microbacterium xanthum]|uniref:hypothetical protein n=1 Tax=Microbacterium xanthum TaxID=3079794 RepID=UPI002AD29824|nr:hypothetical protein [Microbacterium sp. KSW-48]MDZ8170629.1 hypothetical protein [Microbacterium sp. KSW-48]
MGTARRGGTATAAAALAIVLAGCGPAPWEYGDSGDATPSPTRSTSSPAPAPVPNDLSSGSTQRELVAGAVTATVDYWSTLSMDLWTAEAVKPVSISMVTEVTPDDGQKVYLQSATMVAVAHDRDGETLGALDPQSDTSAVSPGYLVLAPYSYSQTFNVGALPADTAYVQLQFTYDFLVQTTPTSKEYAKQTASDMLTVAIFQPGQ